MVDEKMAEVSEEQLTFERDTIEAIGQFLDAHPDIPDDELLPELTANFTEEQIAVFMMLADLPVVQSNEEVPDGRFEE